MKVELTKSEINHIKKLLSAESIMATRAWKSSPKGSVEAKKYKSQTAKAGALLSKLS